MLPKPWLEEVYDAFVMVDVGVASSVFTSIVVHDLMDVPLF